MPYIKVPLNRVISVDRIVTVYRFELDRDYVYDGESHDFWELIYASSGSVFVLSGEREHELRAGEILFHRPGSFHSVRCNGINGASVVIVSFDCRSAAMDLLGGTKMRVSERGLRYIGNILTDAAECFRIGTSPLEPRPGAKVGAEQILRCTLESFLITLIQQREDDAYAGRLLFTSRDELERCLAEDISIYIKERVRERISLDDISAHFHFGKSHICHIFKAKTGVPVIKYLITMKLECAKEMLRGGSLSVGEVAESLSFESSQYFSKLFKRHVGISPGEYARRHKWDA